MGHDQFLIIRSLIGSLPSSLADGDLTYDKNQTENDENSPRQLKLNAALLFVKKWDDAQAAQRRDVLAAQLPDGETFPAATRDSDIQNQIEQTATLLKQSWSDLVDRAAPHQDFENFHDQPPQFWESVAKMSELRTVETYVNGRLEPRVSSRYGELLEIFSRASGAARQIENFLTTLPPAEREIFAARYQINQTFGADQLFAGRGIALDRSGRFPARIFLAENGVNSRLSANTFFSLSGTTTGKTAFFIQNHGAFSNYQFLFDSRTAALLGLSFAFYQNTGAMFSLEELTPEAFAPKNAAELTVFAGQTRLNTKNAPENTELADTKAKRAAVETLVAGALIGGAFKTIENYRKTKRVPTGKWAKIGGDTADFRFAAGATGAMMGATMGCIAPLAEKSFGEIIGFAASVVAGLTDNGLRSLGANALVSVINSGVQTLLSVSSVNQKSLPDNPPHKYLNSADVFENDLRATRFNTFSDAVLNG